MRTPSFNCGWKMTRADWAPFYEELARMHAQKITVRPEKPAISRDEIFMPPVRRWRIVPAEYRHRLLEAIRANGKRTGRQFADELGISASVVHRLIGELCTANLVERIYPGCYAVVDPSLRLVSRTA